MIYTDYATITSPPRGTGPGISSLAAPVRKKAAFQLLFLLGVMIIK